MAKSPVTATAGAVPTSAAPAVCELGGCDRPANDVVREVRFVRGHRADAVFCSAAHRAAWRAQRARRQQCPVCRSTFDPMPSRQGRPAVYCSDRCKTARERQLIRAQRDLARDTDPAEDKLADAIGDAELLLVSWQPKGRTSLHVSELAERYWRGATPPRLVPPSDRARSALVDRLNRLRHRAEELADRSRREALAKREAAAGADRDAARDQLAEQDRVWKSTLLAGD